MKKGSVLVALIIFIFVGQALAASPDIRYVYNTEIVNVRALPSISSLVVGHLLYADEAEILGEDGVWFLVRADVLTSADQRQEMVAYVHSYYITEELPWLTDYKDNEVWSSDCSLTCESFDTFREAMFNFLEGGCYTNVTFNNNGYPVPCDYKFDTTQYVPLRITEHHTVIYGQ